MKHINIITIVSILLLLNACGMKPDVKSMNATYDYNVQDKSTLISSKKSVSSPYKTKVYKLDIVERMRYYDAWDFMFTLDESKVTFYDLNKKGSIMAAKFEIGLLVMPRHHKVGLLVPGMQKLVQEMDERGYKYFQIVSPSHISNYLGFPINNIADLSTYLIPELNNPYDSNIFFRYDMDLIYGQSLSNLLIGGTTKLVVKGINNPGEDDIVWDVKRNLNSM
jgi:hypothetical protein